MVTSSRKPPRSRRKRTLFFASEEVFVEHQSRFDKEPVIAEESRELGRRIENIDDSELGRRIVNPIIILHRSPRTSLNSRSRDSLSRSVAVYTSTVSGVFPRRVEIIATALSIRCSQALQTEIKIYLFAPLIENAAFFQVLTPKGVAEILNRFQEEMFSPGDFIICKGQEGEEMYYF